MFTYEASGSMKLGRCGNNVNFFPKKIIILLFREGDTAWLQYEARKGKLRSIWIKKLKIITCSKTFGQPVAVYFDNNNAVYNEDDLISESDAQSIALAYHRRRLEQAQKALECL